MMCCDVGVGRSAVYMLKSVGESTPPCGTPVFVFLRCIFVVVVECVLFAS